MRKKLLLFFTVMFLALNAAAAPMGEAAITIRSDAYKEAGEDNHFTFLIGTKSAATYTIVDAYGERQETFDAVNFDSSTGSFTGNWVQYKAPANGLIKIYGDASNIDVIIADGAFITEIDMPKCTGLEILSLEHNSLKRLDLTPFTKLSAIYLSDNPFTPETPLKVGAPKDNLMILEIDIVSHLDQSFNLSDYPNLMTFDGYHNMDLYNVDPTGCPKLLVLSVEMAPVSSIDVSKNPELLRLNVSETRLTELDLSHNTKLEHLLAGHDSGSVNTDYYIKNIDLSHNPNLTLLSMNGNRMENIDLSHNTKLTNLSLTRNKLTGLNLAANTKLYSVTVMFNDMDFATLPAPEPTWGEYFYAQNPMEVPRSMAAGTALDLAKRVLRPGTQTSARVWKQVFNGEDVLLDESLWSYSNGKVTFPKAMQDSVYVEFGNSLLSEYTLMTKPFMVKEAAEMNKPSKIVSFTTQSMGSISMAVGLDGAVPGHPKKFYVDFGDGTLREFTSTFASEVVADNVSGTVSGLVSIYIPEGEVLTSLKIEDVALAGIDVSNATELRRLTLKDCGLYEIDLRYNRCLTTLDLSDNLLTNLDLTGIFGDYEKNVLTTLDASDNELSSFTCISTRSMINLNLSDNKLDTFSLKDYDHIATLDLSDNLLTEIDLSYLAEAESIDLSDNMLTTVTPCGTHIAPHFDISGNCLHYGTLPLPSDMGNGYVYAPQKAITIASQSPTVNLTKYDVSVKGNPTLFTWKKADGTLLAEGTDYTIQGGVTTFLNESLGEVYCCLTNATFPLMSGEKALRTTTTKVISRPTHVIASFKTLALNDKGMPSVIFAATEPTTVYIDWKGDGSKLTGYDVKTSYIEYPVDEIFRGANVKVYATSAEDVKRINVFSIYNIRLDEVDLSPLTGAYSINLGYTSLTADQLTLPQTNGLGELSLPGNLFTEYPYKGRFPNLNMLNMSENKLTSFDASAVPDITYLVLSGNQITSLGSFNNANMWNLMADNNLIEEIDLSGLPNLTQLILNSNRLKHINLTPVKNSLQSVSLVANQFTFVTLPLLDDFPKLKVYYYGNQAPVDVSCVDMRVDLSEQATVNGQATEYAWYLGIPEYNPETGEWEGTQLVEGQDYEVADGVTHFLHSQPGELICLMSNPVFPNLVLYTNLLTDSGVEGVAGDANCGPVRVYSLQGILLREAPAAEALRGLSPGIYVIDGKKILVK